MNSERLICIIASQGVGSNHRKYKSSFRPIYLRATLTSLLESEKKIDTIYISYNDETIEGSDLYEETVSMFSNYDSIIFLKQPVKNSQFDHIIHALTYEIKHNESSFNNTHVLFMDDDDLLGKRVLSEWNKWINTDHSDFIKIISFSKLYESIKENFTLGSESTNENFKIAYNEHIKINISDGNVPIYLWRTPRYLFGDGYISTDINHISQINLNNTTSTTHPDFPGTIIPLPLTTMILNYIFKTDNGATDVFFIHLIQAFLKKHDLPSMVMQCKPPDVCLFYRL